MLVNLIPEFLSTLSAADRSAAYHEYLDRHRPILGAYWQNYVLDPESPHAEPIIENALRADRSDLKRLLEDVDVVAIAENAQTYGMGLEPQLLPLWIAHEVAHALRYTSPSSRAALRRLVDELGGYYDGWELGSRATLRELIVNEGVAIAASQAVAPGFEAWEYFGYNRRQYRRLRELDVFLRRAATNDLDCSGLGLRLRYLSGGTSPAARLVAGKVLPERSGYYLGWRLVENYLGEHGAASTVRAAAEELRQADDRASGIQTA